MSSVSTPYHFTKEAIQKEEEQIRLAQQDASKFDVLYNHYFEQIFMFALKRVEDKDVAADITSQIFFKALQNLKKYKPQGLPFASWLYRIARNEIYNMHSANKIKLVVSVESEGVWNMISEIGEEKNQEDFSGLYKVLKKLSESELELIELRFFEKRPFQEISEILEITENNAKVKTYRILDKLKILMQNER